MVAEKGADENSYPPALLRAVHPCRMTGRQAVVNERKTIP